MTARRRCPSCGGSIPAVQFACLADWRRLPALIRHDINRAYGAFDLRPSVYLAAMQRAVAWFEANPAPQPDRSGPRGRW